MKKQGRSAEEIITGENLRVIKQISYDNIIGFVFENIKRKSFPSYFYFGFNIITLFFLMTSGIIYFSGIENSLREFMLYFFSGLIGGSFLVIPLHELFHAIAYKLAGAPSITFGMDLRQMIFYVTADRYVTGRKKFYFVALAPFVSINLVIIFLLVQYPGTENLVAGICFLLFHNIMCIGDFAMISFFYHHREKELCTFDIVENKQSYICERIKTK